MQRIMCERSLLRGILTRPVFLLTAALLFSLMSASNGCKSNDSPKKKQSTPESCLESIPERVPGLRVTGPRSEKNVIRNMVPLVCHLQKVHEGHFQEQANTRVSFDIVLSVEFMGEIQTFSVENNSLNDSALTRKIKETISYYDFDFYAGEEETHIVYPVVLGP